MHVCGEGPGNRHLVFKTDRQVRSLLSWQRTANRYIVLGMALGKARTRCGCSSDHDRNSASPHYSHTWRSLGDVMLSRRAVQ
jgi:hypothetical protein